MLGTQCSNGTCQKWPSAGGTCGLVGADFVGCLDSNCELAAMSATGTCRPALTVGKTCKPSSMGGPYNGGCADGLGCLVGVCAMTDCF